MSSNRKDDPRASGRWHSRGYLPHYENPNKIQSVTFRLHDSVPLQTIERWKQEMNWTSRNTRDAARIEELGKRIEKYEDLCRGECLLRDSRIAAVVQEALHHADDERYSLEAWCIMPNHVHVLIQPLGDNSLSTIVRCWKSYTSHFANGLLDRTGRFWMPEYFDRYIRNEKHYKAMIDYILDNPIKAELVSRREDWPWSGLAVQVGTQSLQDDI